MASRLRAKALAGRWRKSWSPAPGARPRRWPARGLPRRRWVRRGWPSGWPATARVAAARRVGRARRRRRRAVIEPSGYRRQRAHPGRADSSLRRSWMKPTRSRRGLVRPVKSNSPGCDLMPVPGDGELHGLHADVLQPHQFALPERARVKVIGELDGLQVVGGAGAGGAGRRRRSNQQESRRAASKFFAFADAIIFDQAACGSPCTFRRAASARGRRSVRPACGGIPAYPARSSDGAAAGVRVRQIGGGDQRLPVIAAVGDDGGDGIFHPIGDAVRAQIVEQQHFAVQRHAVGLAVGGIGAGS